MPSITAAPELNVLGHSAKIALNNCNKFEINKIIT